MGNLKFYHSAFANYICTPAQMAELVDASDSKSGVRKDVQVRFLFWAQTEAMLRFCILNARMCPDRFGILGTRGCLKNGET